MTLNIALVGCGGMGLRHALGYAELKKAYPDMVRMTAVCDVHGSAAIAVAEKVEELTGERPIVHIDFEKMLATEESLDAVDIATSTPMHHVFAMQAMEAGKHVMVEKPMGLTLKACRQMADVAERTGMKLSVAENYRRDPMNRLAKALVDAGALGRPYFALDMQMSSARGGVMHGTVWRAKKDQAGGMVLDAGVHNADLLVYLMGEPSTVYAESAVFERDRLLGTMERQSPRLAQFYNHRVETGGSVGDTIEHDAADTAFSVIRFKSGAIGQMTLTDVAHGLPVGQSTIHGSEGAMTRPPSRRGTSPVIHRNGDEAISGDALLELVPDFHLDDVTAKLFGGERLGSYEMEFEEIDRKILGIEYADLAQAVESGGRVEVGPKEGADALALAYAALESGELGAPVAFGDVVSGDANTYQREINEALGI